MFPPVAAAVSLALQPSFIVRRLLWPRVARQRNIFVSAYMKDQALVICHLIAHAGAIAERSKDQETPLHLSATCPLLLQSNADP